MNKNIFILPISATFRNIKYPEKIIKSVDGLERRLKGKKLNISIGKQIRRDALSDIYEAKINKTPVLVKHTENVVPATPLEFLIMSEAYDTDISVLKKLEKNGDVHVPTILHEFPKFTTVILDDMRAHGYLPLAEQIIKKKLTQSSAEGIGTALGSLAQGSKDWDEFRTAESAHLGYYEHSVEMLVAFPHDVAHYRFLEDQFCQYAEVKEEQEQRARYYVWPESTPNNMFVNAKGEVIFSNFNRSYWGDQMFMLAVFVAHVMIYSLLNFVTRAKAEKYLKTCIDAYKSVAGIRDEYVFSQYVGMEILHLANGKGMTISSQKDKLRIQALGLAIIDQKAKTIKSLLGQFKKSK